MMAKSKNLIPPDDFCGDKTFQKWEGEMKKGNQGAFKKLIQSATETDGCLADEWASSVTRIRKEIPEFFYLNLQKENKDIREFMLYTVVREWDLYDENSPELFNALDQLIEKYKSDKKRSVFLHSCRTYMQDLTKRRFGE